MTKKIDAIIVEDEPGSRETLHNILQKYCPDIAVVATCASADEAYKAITRLTPQLIFLDIEMPMGNGFELLERFTQPEFAVIFVTAYNQYAIRAIKASALDYLLKPINIKELIAAVERATTLIHARQSQLLLDNLLHNNQQAEHLQHQKIAIPTQDGLQFIDFEQLVRLQADGSYTKIFLDNDESVLATRHLKSFEELLPETIFVRVHHTHLINLGHLVSYQKGEGGSITMSDQAEIPVSRRRKQAFLDRFLNE